MACFALKPKRACLAATLIVGFSILLNAQELPPEQTTFVTENNPNTLVENQRVTVLKITGAIGPVIAEFISNGIESAITNQSTLLLIEMDTPGGLDSAMREIIQTILSSSIPVITYVSPQGARAASAGTYILYASHIAAMAPATNLGAATPVSIGTPGPVIPNEQETQANPSPETDNDANEEEIEPSTAMERKTINDAVAYIKGLADLRNRNAEWAEAAVRTGESLNSESALELNVIDLIAENRTDLFEQLNGWELEINGNPITLDTSDLSVVIEEPDWRTQLLRVISDPSVAYILMLIGIYGLIFEGYNPGAIVPGVVGAISLLLALFAFQVLPINYAGLALIGLGVILMVSEFLIPSFGALGIGGIASFVFGSVILIDSDIPGLGIPIPLIFSVALIASLSIMLIIWLAMKSRNQPVVAGIEDIKRTKAIAKESFVTEGQVWVHGELWKARTNTPIEKGQKLSIVSINGLTLTIEPDNKG
ncbi:MAG: serine protease [Rhodospirillaceae bacterium]|nr:serine protease [Rhodospirillaceae bacterium]